MLSLPATAPVLPYKVGTFFFFFSFLLPNSPESVLIFFLFACLVLIGCYSHQFFSPPRKVTLCFENCTGLEIEVPV